ncbi:MAG: hypothetical protein JNL62_19360 [Bryobacterales bacterium]|nr:hypothetical protein [Bryobacterales bacterium]
MAKEDKPLEYERRTADTKTLAQRLVLAYQQNGHWLRTWRWRLAYGWPLLAALGVAPFLTGIGGGKRVFTNGPISGVHVIFEQDCKKCHSISLVKVQDQDCKVCHDGPRHRSNTIGEARCAECHIEHKGSEKLASVSDANCTRCHGDLASHGKNVKTKALEVTHFAKGKHPDLSAVLKRDDRPLRLNHAIHMPAQAKTIRGIKLPMKCVDCHSFDLKGEAVPVAFDKHCLSCHKGELGFDVYQVLGGEAGIAPHSKDPEGIGKFIREAYTKALDANPGLTQRGLGRNLDAGAPRGVWLETAVRDSTSFVFEKKCRYCHDVTQQNGLPVVEKVNRVAGHFEKGKAEGSRWLDKAEFRHHAHRMVACASCHTKAAQSQKTSDILIPSIETCLECHGNSGTPIDNCSQCHYYHDKTLEKERDRKTIEELIGQVHPGPVWRARR